MATNVTGALNARMEKCADALGNSAAQSDNRTGSHKRCTKDLTAQLARVFAGFPTEVTLDQGAYESASPDACNRSDGKADGLGRADHPPKNGLA